MCVFVRVVRACGHACVCVCVCDLVGVLCAYTMKVFFFAFCVD